MADERRARQGNWSTIIIVAAIVILLLLFLSRRGRGPAGIGEEADTTADTAAVVPQPEDTVDTAARQQPADTVQQE